MVALALIGLGGFQIFILEDAVKIVMFVWRI
jgi:hypothetical protein